MQGEVLNGGFHQFLTNSTGGTGEDVKAFLKEIGAVQTHRLFRRLSRIFPKNKIPRDQDKRCAIVSGWKDQKTREDFFDELDGNFHRQEESLDLLILAYVRSHRDEFIEPSNEVVKKLKRRDRIAKYCRRATEPVGLSKSGAAQA